MCHPYLLLLAKYHHYHYYLTIILKLDITTYHPNFLQNLKISILFHQKYHSLHIINHLFNPI